MTTLILALDLPPRECIVCGADFFPKGKTAKYCGRCSPFVKKLQACVARMIERANLPRAWKFICVDCGKPATDNDHRYYARPLLVDHVCGGCNVRRGHALDVAEITRKLMSSKDHALAPIATWCDWEAGRAVAPEGAVKLFKLPMDARL